MGPRLPSDEHYLDYTGGPQGHQRGLDPPRQTKRKQHPLSRSAGSSLYWNSQVAAALKVGRGLPAGPAAAPCCTPASARTRGAPPRLPAPRSCPRGCTGARRSWRARRSATRTAPTPPPCAPSGWWRTCGAGCCASWGAWQMLLRHAPRLLPAWRPMAAHPGTLAASREQAAHACCIRNAPTLASCRLPCRADPQQYDVSWGRGRAPTEGLASCACQQRWQRRRHLRPAPNTCSVPLWPPAPAGSPTTRSHTRAARRHPAAAGGVDSLGHRGAAGAG